MNREDQHTDLPLDPLHFIVDRMQIEEAWMVRTARELAWWAGPLAQRLRLAEPRDLHGVPVTTLHIETDLLAGIPATTTTWERLAAINRLATLSAYVADVPGRAVRLHASVSMTADNWPMARALALHAVALQIADAHAEAEELARVFGASVGASAHPVQGARTEPDEMVGVVEIYEERGREPSPFSTEEIARLVHVEPRPWLMASSEPTRLLADLDFARGTPARLELDAAATHPSLGSGLQLRLRLPVEPDAAIAQRLNANEAVQPDAHQLGAWCVDDDAGLHFAAFIPSAVYVPELLRALAYHASARNEWARELLFPQ